MKGPAAQAAGTGGTGGGGEGACTDAENQAVYAELEYTDGGSNPPVVISGPAAASAHRERLRLRIYRDSIPVSEGCGDLASAIIQLRDPRNCTRSKFRP